MLKEIEKENTQVVETAEDNGNEGETTENRKRKPVDTKEVSKFISEENDKQRAQEMRMFEMQSPSMMAMVRMMMSQNQYQAHPPNSNQHNQGESTSHYLQDSCRPHEMSCSTHKAMPGARVNYFTPIDRRALSSPLFSHLDRRLLLTSRIVNHFLLINLMDPIRTLVHHPIHRLLLLWIPL